MVTIHIIDRDPAMRLAARRALEAAGFAVSDAEDATHEISSRPDLVIADLTAAGAVGFQRRHPAAEVLTTGGDGLQNPFTPSQLLAAVRLCLARVNRSSSGATTGSRRHSARPRPRRS